MNVYTPDANKLVHEVSASFGYCMLEKTIHLVQYDTKLPIFKVNLFNKDSEYTIPSNAYAKIRFNKPDGNYVYNDALGINNDANAVYFEITQQMTSSYGKACFVVEIHIGDTVMGASTIIVCIDKNPVQEGAIESTDEFKTLEAATIEAVNAKNVAVAAKTEAVNAKNVAVAVANTSLHLVEHSKDFVVNTVPFTNQPTYSGVLANDFDLTGVDYYIVKKVSDNTFELYTDYSFTTKVGETFTLASLSTGNDGTLGNNRQVEFTSTGLMRGCYTSAYRYIINKKIKKLELSICGQGIRGPGYVEILAYPYLNSDIISYHGVGTYDGHAVYTPGDVLTKYKLYVGTYTMLFYDNYIACPYSALFETFSDKNLSQFVNVRNASCNTGYIKRKDGQNLNVTGEKVTFIDLYLPLKNGAHFNITYWEDLS